MNIVCDVDSEFLDDAEKQIFEILLKQRLSYNERCFNKPIFIKIQPILRALGLWLSGLGVAFCVAAILGLSPLLRSEIYLIFFVATGVLCYCLPRLEGKMKSYVHNLSVKSCKEMSIKAVANARKQAPYRAQYDIKGGAISYFREKEGKLAHVWTRPLQGVSIQNHIATIVGKKWTSFIPYMVILHNDPATVQAALSQQHIPCRPYEDI